MTAPTNAVAPAADAAPGTACDVCGHPVEAHDAISLRFCRATLTQALSRSCICKV